MSHFTTIQTQIKDIEALRAASAELDLALLQNADARGYSNTQRHGDYVVRLKGPFDIAVNRQPDSTFGLTTDWWNGSGRSYKLLLTSPATITEPTASFAGWQTTANSQLLEYQTSQTIGGRIAYHLPAGNYQIITKFTQNTPARIIGNLLSLLAIIILFAILITNKIRDHFKRI